MVKPMTKKDRLNMLQSANTNLVSNSDLFIFPLNATSYAFEEFNRLKGYGFDSDQIWKEVTHEHVRLVAKYYAIPCGCNKYTKEGMRGMRAGKLANLTFPVDNLAGFIFNVKRHLDIVASVDSKNWRLVLTVDTMH